MNDLTLRADLIVETLSRLQRRIGERFPESGLHSLCGDLLEIARQASERAQWMGRPILTIRIISWLLAAALLALLVAAVRLIGVGLQQMELAEFVAVLEAGSNEAVLIGAALFFLITFERRIKRRRALAALHELRSVAHVIDMHQLTKDPERLMRDWVATENSPRQGMTPFLLNRYLDYCSEMLSLTGKVAALYVQRFDDGVVLAAVSEVETLCGSLSGKIWQKIVVLEQTPESAYARQDRSGEDQNRTLEENDEAKGVATEDPARDVEQAAADRDRPQVTG